jgi:uncharacterized protein (DUF1330 family)
VLLLDEPTNDLDVDTLRALEEALEDFAGCAVIISHDRWFLDRIATHILAFEGDSHVEWFEGNFQDYEEDKKRRLGIDSVIPHRIKYKKFPGVVQSFGGRFLVRGGAVTPLAGAFVPERVVLTEYPDAAAALAWYTSDAYAPLLTIRLATTEARLVIMARSGGLPAEVHAAAAARRPSLD